MDVPGRLGLFEIQARLGAGGMGEVYRARDTRLNRDVAIKVLPSAVAHDSERLARFRREAQMLAALNHPHIAAIYGIEADGDVQFLVLELIEGETLAERLRGGAMPVDEAIVIIKQICDALAAAHERGVIHRDLKPANIALTPDDRVKVLDFGLARTAASTDDRGLSESPTITAAAMTSEGVILGTAPYMSPEQAKGRVVDKRTDVFAVGCILYEMLTGRRAFGGETVTETLANVIKGDPDWSALPGILPAPVTEILHGTLRKDRKERIADLSTVMFLLERPAATATHPAAAKPATWRSAAWLTAGLAIGLIAAAAITWRRTEPVRPQPVVTRFTYELPAGDRLVLQRRAVALSPDGTRLAFITSRGLSIRAMAALHGDVIAGTVGAALPVFAPDGQSLVYWHEGSIKRMTIGSAATVTLTQVGTLPLDLSWHEDTLFYAPGDPTLMRLAATGGTPEVAVKLPESDEIVAGGDLLPDDETLLITVTKRGVPERADAAALDLYSTKTGERSRVLESASDAQYLPTGHLIFARQGTVFAVPFDARARSLAGSPVPVLEGVGRGMVFGAAPISALQLSASLSGLVAFTTGAGTRQDLDLVLLDQNGGTERLNLPLGPYQFPRVSPDGTKIAVGAAGPREAIIYVHDRGNPQSLRRLTFGGNNRYPAWSADGQRIAFQSDRDGDLGIFWQSASGGAAERLTRADAGVSHIPDGVTRDGRLLFTETKLGRSTLMTLSLSDKRVAPFADVRDSFLPINSVISPDGRWLAYQFSDRPEGGEAVTYIEPLPPTGTKYEVGIGGRPLWSRDGSRLFIVPNPSQWYVASFKAGSEAVLGKPTEVPRWFGVANPMMRRPFDFVPDGRLVTPAEPDGNLNTSQLTEIQFVMNWFDELKSRVPVSR